MILRRHIGMYVLLCVFGYFSHPLPTFPQAVVAQAESQNGNPQRDGQHDFDFNIGNWKTHIKRLQHPLSGSTTWVDYEGTHNVRKVWGGRANLGELEIDGPSGHIQGLALRLYNPQSHQWNEYFANSGDGTLGKPSFGEFKDGHFVFIGEDTFKGKSILVRQTWSDITPNSCRVEQAFSDDGGKTWEVNWVAIDARQKGETDGARAAAQPQAEHASAESDGRHDFDFDFGSWRTHIKRLQHPLTGSSSWIEVNGTVVTQKVWGGRGYLEELELDGPKGHFEGLTMRLYNPQAHQWRLSFSNSNEGTLNQPLIGEFKKGRGEFIDQEPLNVRAILVKQTFSDITPNTHHFEQAFSDDGGKSWEPNWIADLTRDKQ